MWALYHAGYWYSWYLSSKNLSAMYETVTGVTMQLRSWPFQPLGPNKPLRCVNVLGYLVWIDLHYQADWLYEDTLTTAYEQNLAFDKWFLSRAEFERGWNCPKNWRPTKEGGHLSTQLGVVMSDQDLTDRIPLKYGRHVCHPVRCKCGW